MNGGVAAPCGAYAVSEDKGKSSKGKRKGRNLATELLRYVPLFDLLLRILELAFKYLR